ncbi:MAG: ATPase [Pararhodobacter sp.]|nr:ATPase [Pararhodobacter sp.]
MSGWARKVFWKEVAIQQGEDGFAVLLDGRPLCTPAKARLALPSRALAELVAAEWREQEGNLRPEAMPATRSANAAIDKVRGQKGEVAALVAAYGETDLLCYRATAPDALRARQDAAWDPLLSWAGDRYGVRWQVIEGVMPAPQPPETLAVLGAQVASFSAFELTAFHDLVAMTGSLVIGLAAAEKAGALDELWRASRIDEDWQAEQWGCDEEAEQTAALKRRAFEDAARFFAACRE